jgi:hypothetical protein
MLKKLLLVSPLLLLLVVGGVWLLANQRARAVVDNRIEQMLATGAYEDISYQALQVHLNGDISLSDLRVVNPAGEFIFQDIEVSNFDYTNEVPRNLEVKVRGVKLPADLTSLAAGNGTALPGLIKELSTDEILPLEIDYLHSYAPEQQFQLDSDLRVALPGALTLQVNSMTRNLDLQTYNDRSDLDPDPAMAQLQMMDRLQELEIATATLSVQDHGLVAAMLTDMAQQYGSTPEDMRTLLTSQVNNLYLFAPQNMQSLAMDAGQQLAIFLEGGKTLSVSVTPQLQGRLSLLQTELMAAAFIGNFARIVEVLELEIAAQ